MAHVSHLFRKLAPRKPMQAMAQLEIVATQGISGDASQGRKNRQILIVSHAVLDALSLDPGDIRENIVVDGYDVDSITPQMILQVGEAKIQITGPCTPCARMDELRDGLQDDLEGRRGVLGVSLNNAIISLGDPVQLADTTES